MKTPFTSVSVLAALLLAISAFQGYALEITGLTVFGDSLSDEGNTNALAPLPAGYYDGRWSNGPVWVEYLASGLGLPAVTANNGYAATGSNFAYGGSTTGPEAALPAYPVPNLQTQVGLYLTNSAGAGPNASIGTNLFAIWSGGNDIINRVEGGPQTETSVMAANIATAISNLYNAGARQFMIPNLPALGDKPDFRTNPTLEAEANSLVDSFNSDLSFELDQLQTDHPDILLLRLDVHTLVDNIIADPSAYGFSNVTDGAFFDSGADASQYLFWDNTHPTTAGHEWIAQEAMAMVPEPQSFLLLGMGLVLLGSLVWRKKRAALMIRVRCQRR